METTANRLKEAMSIRNMRQVDLIEKTNIPKSAMSQYISGKFLPKQNRLTALAKALNVNESWLMGYDVPMERTIDPVIQSYLENPVSYVCFTILKSIRTPKFDYSSHNIIGKIDIEVSEAEHPSVVPTSYFATIAKDDSMIGKGIIENDILIFDTDVKNIWILDQAIVLISKGPSQEAILRQIILQEDLIILRPYNPNYTPEVYTFEDFKRHLALIGRLLRVNRNYYSDI